MGVAAVVAGFLDQGCSPFDMIAGFGGAAVAEGEASGGQVVVGEGKVELPLAAEA